MACLQVRPIDSDAGVMCCVFRAHGPGIAHPGATAVFASFASSADEHCVRALRRFVAVTGAARVRAAVRLPAGARRSHSRYV